MMRMIKATSAMGLLGVLSAVAGCGEVVPLEEHGCPCASGWSCCGGACVVGSCEGGEAGDGLQASCSGSIDLGTQTVAEGADASISPGVEKVTGLSKGVLQAGEQKSFDYATSMWLTLPGWEFEGWLVSASTGQSFTFQVWAEEDGGAVPLPVVAYGPLEGVGTATCSGTMQGAGVMLGSEVEWQAGSEGTYFVAPFHQVSETSSGLAIQGLDNTQYANAFITMNVVE
jgi:hypothetical protein